MPVHSIWSVIKVRYSIYTATQGGQNLALAPRTNSPDWLPPIYVHTDPEQIQLAES